MDNKYYTYIVRCRDNTLYTGYAKDLNKRIELHNLGKAAKYTRSRIPVKLVYWEAFPTKNQAMSREIKIKMLTRQEKLALIEELALSE